MSNRVEVTKPFMGICYMQVCAVNDATEEEILKVANRQNPAGTTLGWAYIMRGDRFNPVPCDDNPGRTHYILAC
jgi:hypothetical protein